MIKGLGFASKSLLEEISVLAEVMQQTCEICLLCGIEDSGVAASSLSDEFEMLREWLSPTGSRTAVG